MTQKSETQVELLPLSPTFFTAPQDRQSVRTTFNLSEEALMCKAWLSGAWQISQKDVLDHVVEAARKFMESTPDAVTTVNKVLPFLQTSGESTRRTHVISRGALREVEELAEKARVSRDFILENMLRILGHGAMESAKDDIEKREEAQKDIERLWEQAEELRNELIEKLGEDDPVVRRLELINVCFMNLVQAIIGERASGTPIDPDDMGQS